MCIQCTYYKDLQCFSRSQQIVNSGFVNCNSGFKLKRLMIFIGGALVVPGGVVGNLYSSEWIPRVKAKRMLND